MKECIDLHLHLGHSRDGARLTLPGIRKAMKEARITRSAIFPIDEPEEGPTYERMNRLVKKASAVHSEFIPFLRLNPRAGQKAFTELTRGVRQGFRGVKLHPRAEKFGPRQAAGLISQIAKEKIPVILHSSHEENCRPLAWKSLFREYRRTFFVLAHGGKDAYAEAITVAGECPNVWLETSTLSYWRSGRILRALGASRLVFGSDYPYSHPLLEKMKLDLLMGTAERKKVYSDNPKKILGE